MLFWSPIAVCISKVSHGERPAAAPGSAVKTAAHRLYCSLVVYPIPLDLGFVPRAVRTLSAFECASSSPWIMHVPLLEPKSSVVLQVLGRHGLEEHLDDMLMLAATCTHADLRSLPPSAKVRLKASSC